MSSGGVPLLNGRVSRELKASVAVKGEAAHLSAIKLLSDFFTVRSTCPPTYIRISHHHHHSSSSRLIGLA